MNTVMVTFNIAMEQVTKMTEASQRKKSSF